MKKLYYLSTCDTCKRMMKGWQLPADLELQDIKSAALNAADVDGMAELSGSYESLFSKRARLYKERGLGQKDLSESDFRSLLLEHYTFLKRPVLLWENEIFIGNSKKNEQAVADFLLGLK